VVQEVQVSGRTRDIKRLNHRGTETQRASQRRLHFLHSFHSLLSFSVGVLRASVTPWFKKPWFLEEPRTLKDEPQRHRDTVGFTEKASFSPFFPFSLVFLCGGSPCPCDSVVQKALVSGRT
jgi:hypothetical protein